MEFYKEGIIGILETTPERISPLIDLVPASFLHFKERSDEFSVFDILGHLIHGEKTDWIPRLQLMLEQENPTFDPFDRFAQFKDSKDKSLDDLLQEFRILRNKNIQILESTHLDLKRTGIHPSLGVVNVEQLLNCWVVHDLTHINQINRILAHQFDPVGPWKEYLRILND
jgi:hypothetical protein